MKRREGKEKRSSGAPRGARASLYASGHDAGDFLPPYETDVLEPQMSSVRPIVWSAAEVVVAKGFSWFAVTALCVLVLSALAALLTRDVTSTVTVLVALTTLLVYARRKPITQQYALDENMISVDKKQYSIHSFRSFGVDDHSLQPMLVFVPFKRFMPHLVVPLDPKKTEEILGMLNQFLPFEQYRPDLIDILVRKCRL